MDKQYRFALPNLPNCLAEIVKLGPNAVIARLLVPLRSAHHVIYHRLLYVYVGVIVII